MLQFTGLIDLVLIMIGVSLICAYWEPPLQKSLQAVIVLVLSCILGVLLGKGVATGLLAGTVAFWRGELINIVKDMKEESKDLISLDKKKEEEE